MLVLGVEQKLNLVDRTGVVFEAAHDGRIDANAVSVSGLLHEVSNRPEFRNTVIANSSLRTLREPGQHDIVLSGNWSGRADNLVDGIVAQSSALGEVAALIFAA